MNRLTVLSIISLFMIVIAFLLVSEGTLAQENMSLLLSADSYGVFTSESTEIYAVLTDSEGEPVAEKEITFTVDGGTVDPETALTDADGEATVIFIAPDESGTSLITAKVDGMSETVEIEITSTFQWVIYMLMCLLGILGAGGGTALYLRRAKESR